MLQCQCLSTAADELILHTPGGGDGVGVVSSSSSSGFTLLLFKFSTYSVKTCSCFFLPLKIENVLRLFSC